MSSGPVKRVSREDIQRVQNLIERCLQLYMNQKEVVQTLVHQAKIEPGLPELVWQKLEEENQEFFKAYYLRLTVMEQINQFNRLLEKHVQLMHQLQLTSVASLPASNGSHILALSQNPLCYIPEQAGAALKPENMQQAVGSSLHNVFNNGGSSLHTSMHAAVEMSAHGNGINGPQGMLSAQRSNMGLIHGINGGLIKSEPGYSGSSPYMFGAEGNVQEARPTIGDTLVTSFASVDPNSHSLNEALLDPDTSSFGILRQVSRDLSISDLTADYSLSSDILDSYPRSAYLVSANRSFLERGEQSNQRLDSNHSMSEGLSYEDFRSVNNR